MLEHMAEIASFLGKKEDTALYLKYSDRQAKLVRPLYMKLLDEEQETFAKGRLLKALDNYNWRLGTGFLSTPFILYVLQDIDIECAYRLLENEEMPVWLFMAKMGGKHDMGKLGRNGGWRRSRVVKPLFQRRCLRMVIFRNVRNTDRRGKSFRHCAVSGRKSDVCKGGLSEHLRKYRMRVGKVLGGNCVKN